MSATDSEAATVPKNGRRTYPEWVELMRRRRRAWRRPGHG